MRYSLAMLLFVGVAGCSDFEKAMESERQVVSPPGILPVDDMAGDNLGDNANGNNPEEDQVNGDATPPDDTPPKRTGIIGKTTAKVIDMQAEMAKNPNLKVVENKVGGGDPITVAASAYISMSSRIAKLSFENNLKTWKAINDNRNPSYKEFMVMAKDLNFAMLPPYQMYGYDTKTGSLVTLEDKADKKKRYEAAGIPFEG
jgi:hypothetical protein